MKVTIIHPGEQSLNTIERSIEENNTIYRSPHVGNVNGSELRFMMGIDEMGGTLQLEMVDTIRSNDRYSNPRIAMIGERTVALASLNYSSSRIPSACLASTAGLNELEILGVKLPDESGITLQQLHLNTLTQAVPETIRVTPSSAFFASIGKQAYNLVLQEASMVLDRPLRMVNSEGKIREVTSYDNSVGVFGLGAEPRTGMMPIEFVKKVMDNQGRDSQIVHVAGPDMVRYTKEDSIMEPAIKIATSVASKIGLSSNASIDYVLPCMKTLLNSKGFSRVVGEDITSQYDILLSKLPGEKQ